MRRSAAPDTPGTGPSPSPVGPEGSWRGRADGDGPEHARWHQRVRSATDSPAVLTDVRGPRGPGPAPTAGGARQTEAGFQVSVLGFRSDEGVRRNRGRDRKSTRLNSSHVAISYAVFCLKQKTNCEL